jgi:TIR domain
VAAARDFLDNLANVSTLSSRSRMPGVFICYRRDDTGGYAGHLFDRLARQFGTEQIFMDIDAIPIGDNFVQVIDQRIRSCNVMIVLIGKNWVLADPVGRRRIDEPADFVRLEIEAALAQNITVIPVLVGGARMPPPEDLPSTVVRLAYLNAFEIYDRMFEESVAGLVSILRPLVKTPIWQRWRQITLTLSEASRQLVRSWFLHPYKRSGLLATTALLLFALFFFATRLRDWSRTSQSARSSFESHESLPPLRDARQADRGLDASANKAPAIEFNAPVRVSSLPPVVEAARHVSNVGRDETGSVTEGFETAAGPHNPTVIWKADFPSLGVFLGLAGDGTLYFEAPDGVYAIRDGKQQWGYKFGSWDGPTFATDGRLWVKQQTRLAGDDRLAGHGDYRFLVYNSHGEGGVTAAKGEPERFVTYSLIRTFGWGSGGVSGWTIHHNMFEYTDCGLGELLGKYDDPPEINKPWRMGNLWARIGRSQRSRRESRSWQRHPRLRSRTSGASRPGRRKSDGSLSCTSGRSRRAP